MQGTLLLNSNENTRKVEEEQKTLFVKSIIELAEIPLEGLELEEEELSLETRIKLREILSKYSIKIIDYPDGHLEIYDGTELIAEWKKCEYVLKRDITTIDPTKKLYLEMKIDFWSVFENT